MRTLITFVMAGHKGSQKRLIEESASPQTSLLARESHLLLHYALYVVLCDVAAAAAATTSHYRSGIFTAACITSPLECVIHFFTPF
jgi:hypothetical protein